MRIVIAGGGTGGHVIPALAIADVLKEAYGAEVLLVGTSRGMETRLVPQAGYPLELIPVGQLNRVGFTTKIKTMAALPRAFLICRSLLTRWKPQVVVGVGGYASGPVMLAAIVKGIPTLAFEPNAVPGLANRWIGRYVTKAAVNFPSALSYFRNGEATGIPVRAEFFHLAAKIPKRGEMRLLVIGGSQGARVFNRMMPEIAGKLLEAFPGLSILHQAGARHADTVAAAYESSGAPADRWELRPFLDGMAKEFEAADLILARSGASTVAELTAAGKASLLVPLPTAADDHQRRNAEALVEAGAAQMLLEPSLTAEGLLSAIQKLLDDHERLVRMAEKAKASAHPEAAQNIAALIASLAQTRQ
jgi:UDP-N-acetylglucosamine--N-acetylmuramyl-(pentapeptide) pyrophosphoryl-undecaprenol N-acetylglucosamine transferase